MSDLTKFISSTILTVVVIVFHVLWCVKHKRDLNNIKDKDIRDTIELEKIIMRRHRIGTYVVSFLFLVLMNIIFRL